jgi:dihydroorotate dehydrogenase (fumarate)
VASSSPLTGSLDGLLRLEDAGAGAVVLPSLFEEQLAAESLEIDRLLEAGAGTFGEALDYFPELDDYNTGPDRHLELLHQAKQRLGIPVIASLNGTTPGGWLEHAKLLEQAGADALELNLYGVAADPEETADELERRDREIVDALRRELGIPLAVKLSPFFTASPTRRAVQANRRFVFFKPLLPARPRLEFEAAPRAGTSEELRLPRRIAILRGRLDASLAATSGVHTPADALKALLAGADAVMMASALLQHGPEHLRGVERGMLEWMRAREYESVEQLKGSLSQRCVPDPDAFERANYLRVLKSWSSSFRS